MQQVDRGSVKFLMEIANINPSKDKGQNFLVDTKTCENIVNLLKNDANSRLIEVGPGLGSLTYYLEKKVNNLTVIDIDERIVNYLSNEVNNNTNIIFGDALKYDFSSYEFVISNIPYNITKDLIVHLLISARNAKQFVFMVQKENYAHFTDISGSEYGPSSVLIHLLGNIKKAFDVKASSFVPAPKCTSTVFTIDRNNDYDFDMVVDTYKVASKLFLNRRKTILNNLSSLINKEEAIKILATLNINVILRPEQISPKQYFELTKFIKEKGYHNV
ncbi:MAG: 16S rRNA (adenine(1518)-N(6)/adenine(1519)-N(6))-dimethyltransferase RsmA [Bacilli bacterium]|nr:16S rRNA (adenine(1518)-N(6)/adenine(1519)-N(6))-dimethyltransferase RsmA [Bacilli bacterium]